jgi:hypothetical protein
MPRKVPSAFLFLSCYKKSETLIDQTSLEDQVSKITEGGTGIRAMKREGNRMLTFNR